MSITVSTPAQICQAPSNTSQAKHLFSFQKAKRFPQPPKSACNEFVYDLPSAQETRATGFGYGKKYDFTKEGAKGVPAPNTYPQPSDFDRKHPNSPSFSFGVSREQVEKRYIEGHFKADPSIPGPGTYNPQKPLGAEKVKYSIRPRTSAQGLFEGNPNPGPGAYAPKTSMSSTGAYFLSKFRSSGACSFSPKTSERFRRPSRDTISMPGPGKYKPKYDMSDKGDYFVSRFKSSMCRTFSHGSRTTLVDDVKKQLNTPGPGSYRLPSDFGYYESKHSPHLKGRVGSAPSLRVPNRSPK